MRLKYIGKGILKDPKIVNRVLQPGDFLDVSADSAQNLIKTKLFIDPYGSRVTDKESKKKTRKVEG